MHYVGLGCCGAYSYSSPAGVVRGAAELVVDDDATACSRAARQSRRADSWDSEVAGPVPESVVVVVGVMDIGHESSLKDTANWLGSRADQGLAVYLDQASTCACTCTCVRVSLRSTAHVWEQVGVVACIIIRILRYPSINL